MAWPAAWRSHFGRKTHVASWLAVGPAQSEPAAASPRFSTRMAGSYERQAWKQVSENYLPVVVGGTALAESD